jgi:hypothetical protein
MENENISHIYYKVIKCVYTGVLVERSFSMLNKINAKDRKPRRKNLKAFDFAFLFIITIFMRNVYTFYYFVLKLLIYLKIFNF